MVLNDTIKPSLTAVGTFPVTVPARAESATGKIAAESMVFMQAEELIYGHVEIL